MDHVPRRIARYEVERELGAGGMGTVYLARDPDLGRRVAIKLIQARLDSPELRERFGREALTVATLNHPHIVTVYDSGQYEKRPFLVLEYIQGRSVARVIAERETLPIVTRLRWLEELCDGLQFAHQTGIVHRDIKPANVMLDHLGRLKILDFGIARMTGAASTAMSGPIGTPGYMAPEYIRSEAWDHRIDIFAAGAVAYELLAYRPAFPGDTAATVMHRVITADPDPLSDPSSKASVDEELESVVRSALAKRPENRYRTAGQFRDALHAVRERLERGAPERTTPVERFGSDNDDSSRRRTPDGRRTPRSTPGSGGPQQRPTPATPNRSALDDAVKRRRDHLIRSALARAENELADGRLDDAMAACIEAATLDEGYPETIDMTARIQRAIDEREADGLLGLAQQELERGALTAAHDLVDSARALCSTLAGADPLEEEIVRKQKEREVERQRAQQFRSLMSEARGAFAIDDLPAALVSVQCALQLNPKSTQALDLQRTLQARIEERDRIEQENRRARDVVLEAKQLFAAGEHERALATLRGHKPPHAQISRALEELEQELRAIRRAEIEAADVAEPVAQTVAAGRGAMAAGNFEMPRTILREADPTLAGRADRERPAAARDYTETATPDRRLPDRRSLLTVIGVPVAALVIILTAGIAWLSRETTDTGSTTPDPVSPVVRPPQTVVDPPPFVPPTAVTPEPGVVRVPEPAPQRREDPPPPRPIQGAPVNQPTQPGPLAAPVQAPPPQASPASSAAVLRAKSFIASGAFGDALVVLEREDPNSLEVSTLIAAARDGLRSAAESAMNAAKTHESAGNGIAAVEQYQRAHQLDPSTAVAAEASIARLRARMKADAEDALTRARQYDALDRIDDAIMWYDRAFRNLLDDDPARKLAKERVDALRARK